MNNEKIISKIEEYFWNNYEFREQLRRECICCKAILSFYKYTDLTLSDFNKEKFVRGFRFDSSSKNIFYDAGFDLGFEGFLSRIDNYFDKFTNDELKLLIKKMSKSYPEFHSVRDDIARKVINIKYSNIEPYLYGIVRLNKSKNDNIKHINLFYYDKNIAKLTLLASDYFFIRNL